jgi:4-amino-4-deoxy-L-arabinose transferase-like glycosyltransferase
MVARNFTESDQFDIFHPAIDIAGEKTGITGMEFPIYNYGISIIQQVFGFQHWYGRLINLLISSIGIWFFFKITRDLSDKDIAFYATLILLGSIWFSYSRKIMPDTLSMSLILMGCYYGLQYFVKNKSIHLLWLGLFICLGLLIKLPSGFLLPVFAIAIFNAKFSLPQKVTFSIVACISAIPALIWYFYWVPHLVDTYEFWHFFMGDTFSQGFTDITTHWNETAHKFYEMALKFVGFAAYLYGIYYILKTRNKLALWILGISTFCFIVIIFKAGNTFYRHDYYVIPFVPVMAWIAAIGINSLPNIKWKVSIVSLILIEGLLNQVGDFTIPDKHQFLLSIETELDTYSDQDDLFLINSDYLPTPMYFTHRKGWVNINEKIVDLTYIDELKSKGLKYILILKKTMGTEVN